MKEVSEDSGFKEDEEDNGVDIDDEFEEIEEEEFDENNDSGFEWHGCIGLRLDPYLSFWCGLLYWIFVSWSRKF